MRVLVTGAHGFLGHALTRDLRAAGHDVATLTRQPTKPSETAYLADLRDRDQVRQALHGTRFDAVCHLAALTKARESFERPLEYWDVNVTGTLNLLRAVNDDAALVLASTGAVYGSDPEGALDEDHPLGMGSPYAASKQAEEQIITATAEARGSRSAVLRCFNIAGAVADRTDTDTSRAIPALLRVAAGHSDSFIINGDGTALRDYTHVVDVARAFRLAIESDLDGQHIYNVGTGEGLSLTDLVNTARDITGRDIPVRHQPPKREPQRLVANSQRIALELHWRPSHSDPRTMLTDAWTAASHSRLPAAV